jgi:hypothetical protein
MKMALLFLVLLSSICRGQNIGINTTGNPANASAILDVSSTTEGVLIPRMTTVQRDAIAAPATGLVIFNLTTLRFDVHDGLSWHAVNIGCLAMLSNSESNITGTVTTANVKSYTVPANLYSQIMVEVEIGLDQSGNTDAEWIFDIQYAGVSKASSSLRQRGNNASDSHKTVGIIKYSELMPAGGVIRINITSVSANGTWRLNSLRIYGVI